MKPIFVLNGPNLNLLGEREPDVYGRETLHDIERRLQALAAQSGLTIDFRQTNHEGVLVDYIQESRLAASALILNAGAYTHTSIAIRDALQTVTVPIVECHLSNIYKREPFRHRSYISGVATGVICGFGSKSYDLALSAAIALIQNSAAPRSSDLSSDRNRDTDV
jgi:3-dehydroquinate dehydratase-2